MKIDESQHKMLCSEFPDILSVDNLQKILKIGKNNVYRFIYTGAIKHMRIGRSIKIPKTFLIDYILTSCYNVSTVTGNLSCQDEEGLI